MRIIHRLYALVTGYFWIPCPRCGRMFGGHEAKGFILDSYGPNGRGGRMTCSHCPGIHDDPQHPRVIFHG